MIVRKTRLVAALLTCAATVVSAQNPDYLKWTPERARQILTAARVNGRVGGVFGFRGLNTDRAFNYKLRATWLTADVVRATARQIQLSERLTDRETEALVAEAAAIRGTVVLIEVDPNEGSGVIPLEWTATLDPLPHSESSVGTRGVVRPAFRNIRALSGGFLRDYNYDVFWLEFPLESENGEPAFPAGSTLSELIVRIHDKEGRVSLRASGALRVLESSLR